MNDQLVTEIKRRAMATEFAVVLPGEDYAAIEKAVDALDRLSYLESLMTIYQPNSDISQINRRAGESPAKVSPEIVAVLRRAQAISALTDRAFDVTAGPLIECWGFNKRRGRKPTEDEIELARSLVDNQRLILDEERHTAELKTAGMRLNLGGIGKGFAIDRIADELTRQGIEDFLIHGGRSSILARGSDRPDRQFGWTIAIEHPMRPGIRLGQITLRDRALATSGSGKQFFHYRGKRQGHVIDPRTGRPAGDYLSLTVVTPTATDADALSTACFVTPIARLRETIATDSPPTADRDQPTWPEAIFLVVAGQRQGEVTVERIGEPSTVDWHPVDTKKKDTLPREDLA